MKLLWCLSAATLVACSDSITSVPESTPDADAHASLSRSIAEVYELTDLGTLGGAFAVGRDVNNADMVVGSSQTATGTVHAFVWAPGDDGGPGTMQDLGTLGGANSDAFAINERGDIVGRAFASDGTRRPVLWRKIEESEDEPAYQIIELPSLGGRSSAGFGINDRGDIIGFSLTPDAVLHPVLWTADGVLHDLGTFGGINGQAFDINDKGEIVAARDVGADLFTTAFVYSDKKGFRDLGNLGGTGPAEGSIGQRINVNTEVAGYSITADGVDHAFFWSESTGILDLGTLGGAQSLGFGINQRGAVVGMADNSAGLARAFLWTMADGMRDLGALMENGSSLAWAINDRGSVTGSSDTVTGETHATLWRLRPTRE
jgi:probable HAF family extracellular repeat protein